MKVTWASSIVAAIILAAGSAAAQSPRPPAPGGAFESLSPGNQKVALAIFDSERRADPTAASKPLSLDQIAERKRGGEGWGDLFHDMKTRGLVEDRNLGQAISRTHRVGGATAAPRRTVAPVEIATASGRTMVVGGHGRGLRGTAAGATAAGGDAEARRGRTAADDDDATAAHGRVTAADRHDDATAGHRRMTGADRDDATAAHGRVTAASGRASAAHGGVTVATRGATAAFAGATAAHGGATAAHGGATAARVSAGSHGGARAR